MKKNMKMTQYFGQILWWSRNKNLTKDKLEKIESRLSVVLSLLENNYKNEKVPLEYLLQLAKH